MGEGEYLNGGRRGVDMVKNAGEVVLFDDGVIDWPASGMNDVHR